MNPTELAKSRSIADLILTSAASAGVRVEIPVAPHGTRLAVVQGCVCTQCKRFARWFDRPEVQS